jgi:hypothetical protein
MRLREITPPSSHPHVAEIRIDPADLHRLERLVEEDRTLRLLNVDDSEPDQWTVRIGCASVRVRERFEDGWA